MPFFSYEKLPLQSPTRKRLSYIADFGETNVYAVSANGTPIGYVAKHPAPHNGKTQWCAWDKNNSFWPNYAPTRDRAAACLEEHLMRQQLGPESSDAPLSPADAVTKRVFD
jgi:hypothetical protein